ncbi:hypothetical protein OHV13_06675 [Kitasatospora purpeofusca]|uniref:hypothetical protein n=1 Tax=Kitasatospora purpeofusca TaxID=67352 RepID=UPI0032517EC6
MPRHPESPAGGEPMPAPDMSRTEVGRCVNCRSWAWGYFIEDLTASVALVEHCAPAEPDSSRLTAAAGVSVAAVVVVCVLLLTIWR